MRLIAITAAALLAVGVTVAPASAQPRDHGHGWHHRDGRHLGPNRGWGHNHRWHHRQRVCRVVYRHHHRERRCFYR